MNLDASYEVMQRTANDHYHKGHYNCTGMTVQESLSLIRNPEWDFGDEDDSQPGFSYEDADIFWMGSCDLFSLALHKELGLPIFELRGCDNRLIHSFCILEYSGQRAFIDVRGITTDSGEFCHRLCRLLNEKVTIIKNDNPVDPLSLSEDEKFGYRFALWILSQNRKYYEIE